MTIILHKQRKVCTIIDRLTNVLLMRFDSKGRMKGSYLTARDLLQSIKSSARSGTRKQFSDAKWGERRTSAKAMNTLSLHISRHDTWRDLSKLFDPGSPKHRVNLSGHCYAQWTITEMALPAIRCPQTKSAKTSPALTIPGPMIGIRHAAVRC